MYSADSTSTQGATAVQQAVQDTAHANVSLHPSQVLKKLPRDATPWQQDSAIQASIHVENTHLSTRPDTLHLPGQDKGKSYKDISIPLYYKESFFSKDSLYHPEIIAGRYGVAGDPVPYTIKGDNIITAMLLGGFILALIAFANSRRFIFMQARNFFLESCESRNEMTETTSEYRFQFFFLLQACLLLSVIAFIYTQDRIADTFVLESQYHLIAIFFGSFSAYFIIKMMLQTFVNWVFFDSRSSSRWFNSSLFITSAESIAIFPLVMLMSYFDLSTQNAVTYMAIVIISVKILSFYKCLIIFFKRNAVFSQIFLYFCALEIMPLLLLYGTLATIIDYLKINF
ncbi:DUF4271 domain-containing protein [Xylanibacter caecicola]|uniref:DUF4271 domain-containing protein n=1 Tax=Xylanibacter caecicola TaxID=2736294 RepID=UPI00258CD058|nr:DUF4271 domain-containing protein [Xylanibacter caecicola]